MPKKRKAFVHIGLDDGSGDQIDPALEFHQRALAELGVRRPAESSEEMFRAALEILRCHQDWGYKRSEVEGTWTSICRRGFKGKETLVFSQSLLAAASAEQVALLVDALNGFEVHVVVTVRAPDVWTVPGAPEHDLSSVLERWKDAVRSPERLHVIVAGRDEGRKATWKAFGRVVGFGTSSLKLGKIPHEPRTRAPHLALASRATVLRTLGQSWAEHLQASAYDVVGDVADLVPGESDLHASEPSVHGAVGATELALSSALQEVERLSRRNETLELRLAQVEKKRRKLKRRLSDVA